MDSFLKVFGKISVSDIVLMISAIAFLIGVYLKVKKYLINKYEHEKEKDARINKVLDLSENYPIWHQQSLDIQDKFTRSITRLEQRQEQQGKKLEDIEEDRRERDKNKLYDRLQESFKYYTSNSKNPIQSWTEMEKDAFFKLFRDYEKLGGNGYMHSVVLPAMRLLEVIPMHETERVSELMQSRQ